MQINIPEKIQYVINLFYENGYEAFAVGGCIRDSMLGKPPHDWDLTTNAKPEQIKKILCKHKTIETGIQYGTVTLLLDNEPIEITTYRMDMGYDDNRHPKSVEFLSDIKADLSRRDFTINAMAYNHREGLIDLFNGADDLAKKIIRTVGKGEARFEEDELRILRGIRFAAKLDFDIEPNTEKAIHKCKNLLKKTSGERLNTEFTKILLSQNAAKTIRKYSDVFGVFMPELLKIKDVEQNHPYHVYTVFEHTMKSLENTPPDKIIRYAILFHDLGKADTKTTDENGIDHFYNHPAKSQQKAEIIMQRLKFSNDEINQISKLVTYHDTPIICDEYHIKRWLNRHGEKFFSDLLNVKTADINGQNPKLINRLEDIPKYTQIIKKIIEEKQCFSLKDMAINGNDLKNIGFKSSRKLGKALDMLLDEIMQGNLPNQRDTLLAQAKKYL